MSAPPASPRPTPLRRMLLWAALVLLLAVAQSLLVWLTVAYEDGRAQEAADELATSVAAEVKREAVQVQRELQLLAINQPGAGHDTWQAQADALLQGQRAIVHLERRNGAMEILSVAASPFSPPLFSRLARNELDQDTVAACTLAQRLAAPQFSRSYFVPLPNGQGAELVDLCLPRGGAVRAGGFVVASFALSTWLESALVDPRSRTHELSFVESDGARLARAGAARGAGVYVATRLVDLPGQSLQLRVDSAAGRPSLIPNLAVALVIGLSLALFAVVLLLARDGRRRAVAEAALAESLAFRKAMEDSLSTGLRARDLEGRLTYANPAFCAMVGWPAEDLLGRDPPAYWPPEQLATYRDRQTQRLAPPAPAGPDGVGAAREGFETLFMRSNGERFPVMIYEAPLVNGNGAHSGWMSAVLDLSEQRRVEELARAQQERLQASARLATMGEMASLLSHELNQPLAAIASYATGSLNLIDADTDTDAGTGADGTQALVREGLQHIAEQAERAGRVIKSVHGFVRRREPRHERIGADALIEAVLPLVRMAARDSGARIEVEFEHPMPMLRCDRTMVEQVMLNLARNGLQAMVDNPPGRERVLRLAAARSGVRWVAFEIVDTGCGIAPEVAAKLFTPFYTTRHEGLGLGLSLCRTVVEQHGGTLEFDSPWPARGEQAVGGTRFRFTLAAA